MKRQEVLNLPWEMLLTAKADPAVKRRLVVRLQRLGCNPGSGFLEAIEDAATKSVRMMSQHDIPEKVLITVDDGGGAYIGTMWAWRGAQRWGASIPAELDVNEFDPHMSYGGADLIQKIREICDGG